MSQAPVSPKPTRVPQNPDGTCPDGYECDPQYKMDGCSIPPFISLPLQWLFRIDTDNPAGEQGTSFSDCVSKACDEHDKCYQKQEKSRRECDENIRQAMAEACRNAKVHPVRCKFFTYTYFVVLRAFGWLGWLKNKLFPLRYCCRLIELAKQSLQEESASNSASQSAPVMAAGVPKLAARVGDLVAHPTPPVLTGGTGSPDVIIGGQPAWRAQADVHVCATPSPPHGAGVVQSGSGTVFINYLPAARAGDKIIEASGPPNFIINGCSTVVIGD